MRDEGKPDSICLSSSLSPHPSSLLKGGLTMLVLQRRPGERVRLTLPDGTLVWITIADVRSWASGCVALGIDAPSGVRVLREELIYRGPVFRHGTSPREDDGQLE